MRVFCISSSWLGGLMNHLTDAFAQKGFETRYFASVYPQNLLNKLKLHQISYFNRQIESAKWKQINHKLKVEVADFKPDIVVVLNNSYILPETLADWRKHNSFQIITLVADFPFDSFRFKTLPYNLPFSHFIFTFDRAWHRPIQNIAPSSRVESIYVGFNSQIFKPVEVSEEDKSRLACDLAFTGESYGKRAEGGYRCAILNSLTDIDLKLWGDTGWMYQFEYYPALKKHYQGGRLSYDDLFKLYRIAKINLNMPSPQIITSFQPRIFEIGACKGFQIADERDDLSALFDESKLVMFKDIHDLKEKVNYYLENPIERDAIVNNFYNDILLHHTWENRVDEIMSYLL